MMAGEAIMGRANLVVRTGALDEAGRLLDACLRCRPDDVPVWCARLSRGPATRRSDVVQLPSSTCRPPR